MKIIPQRLIIVTLQVWDENKHQLPSMENRPSNTMENITLSYVLNKKLFWSWNNTPEEMGKMYIHVPGH